MMCSTLRWVFVIVLWDEILNVFFVWGPLKDALLLVHSIVNRYKQSEPVLHN